MRRNILLVILLVFALSLSATTVTTTNPVTIPDGVTPFNGRVTLYLPAPAYSTATNQQIMPVPITQRLVNGKLFSSLSLIGNDAMSPSMYYMAKFTDPSGRWITTLPYRITGTTFDLGSAPPTPVTTNNVYVQDLTGLRTISGGRIGGMYIVDGVTYTTIQSAINAAGAAGGGTVLIPPGTYAQGSIPFTWFTSVNVVGSGYGEPDVATCPTTITTTLTSGTLVPFVNVNDASLSGVCIKNIGAGGGTAVQFSSGHGNSISRIYAYGPFATQVSFFSSSIVSASTIWNNVDQIHCANTQAGGTGIKFDSSDAVAKVINNNNVLQNHCTGGVGGKGLWFTNTNQAQVINENIVNCSECNATGGTAIQFDQGATADTILIGTNAEGSTTCFNKATANTVNVYGGNFSACTTAITDAQPGFTRGLGTARVQAIVPNYADTAIGGQYVDSIGLGGVRPSSIAIDGYVGIGGNDGWCLSAPVTCRWLVKTTGLVPNVAGGADLGSATSQVGHLYAPQIISKGNAPTCSATGIGATGTCAVVAGSTDLAGVIALNVAGAGPAANGTATLTFNAAYGTNGSTCTINPFNGTGAWNARVSLIGVTRTTATFVFNWDNNAVALVAGNQHGITYHCEGL